MSYWPDAYWENGPSDIFLVFEVFGRTFIRLYSTVGISVIFGVLMCVTMTYKTYMSLKRQAAKLSRQTYRLHIQLIALLGFQVSL